MSAQEQEDSHYSLELIPESDIVLFHWRGPITLEDRRHNVKRMVGFCHEHGIRNLIIDGRDHISKTGTLDAFEFGTEVPIDMKGLRIAVVCRPDDVTLKFIETVAHNRGAVTNNFASIELAKYWLESFDLL